VSAELASRALAFDAAVFERAAQHVARVPGARALSHPVLPLVLDLNAVQLEADLPADEVEALADELQAGAAHRRVVVSDERVGARLEPELTARGWEAEHLLLLARDGALAPPSVAVLAEEVPYGQVRGLREEWIRSEPGAQGDELARQVLDADRLLFAATPTRAFAVFEQGRALAYGLLLTDARDGMLEDVYTTPAARGRGLGAAVIAAVLHAARGERCEAVFVPTDADGRARALYERMGFSPAAVVHRYQRWLGR
jgi:GNAT superfamily N-acetyltransferase